MKWTERQVETLRTWYPKEGANPMRYEGHTAGAIRAKARIMGIPFGEFWTEKEDDILRRRYLTEGTSLARILKGRSAGAIADRALRLGIKSGRRKGITKMSDLTRRCKFDFDKRPRTEKCWHWACACSGSATSKNGKVPVAWLPSAGRTVSVARIAALFAGKIESDRDPRTVWRTCRSDDCINPAHLAVGTRTDYGAWAASAGVNAAKPAARRLLRAARMRDGIAKLTPELALWILESHQSGVEIAHALSCSATAVSRVRCGRSWGVEDGVAPQMDPMSQMAAALMRIAPSNDITTKVAA